MYIYNNQIDKYIKSVLKRIKGYYFVLINTFNKCITVIQPNIGYSSDN